MSKPLTVSIAMCTYNGERHLRAQLQSLRDQTRHPDELIICDDASHDSTLAIIDSFAQTAPFAVHIQKNTKNLGYVKNFEQAISLCTQDIVFLCDQDDVWEPTKISEVLACFDAEPAVGMVLHHFINIDGEGAPYIQAPERYGTQKLLASDLPEDMRQHSIQSFLLPQSRAWCGCMSAFKQEFTRNVLPIFEGKGHDDWILKLIAPLSEIRFMAKPLIQY
jgi:glycosyltransferase involved in cell wall biosynthesis